MQSVYARTENPVKECADVEGSSDVADVLTTARFPSVSSDAGHYESFYLKMADPERARGVWIRHTVFKRPDEPPVGSLWCILWREGGRPVATKLTLAAGAVGADAGEYIHVGQSRMALGRADGGANEARWALTFSEETPRFTYQPREWLYRSPVPRTKSLALHPVATFRGHVAFGDQELEIDGWPGMVGHNWGAEHAEEWIWLHGAGFPDAPGAWFDGTIVRVRLGRVIVPWIANGCLHLDGRRHRLRGPAQLQSPVFEAGRTRCTFKMRSPELTVRGTVGAPADQFVAWRYSDPAGGEHVTTNCSVAAMTLDISRPGGDDLRLHVPAGAAYELGRRGEPAGIPIQPFTDP